MFKFFSKKKSSEKQLKAARAKSKIRNYPEKVVLAMAEAVVGNKQAIELLTKAGFEELVITVYALQLKNDARDWLMQNGFAHLMAFVNTVEGVEEAGNWLRKANLDLYFFAGIAGDGRQEGYVWLQKEGKKEWILLCKRIQDMKDDLEERHNDMHQFGE